MNKTIKAVKGSLKYGLVLNSFFSGFIDYWLIIFFSFEGPKGENINYKFEKKNPTRLEKHGFYGGEFTGLSVGRHRIDILNFNVPIKNSPQFVNVFDSQLADIINRPNELVIGSDNLIEGMHYIQELETFHD